MIQQARQHADHGPEDDHSGHHHHGGVFHTHAPVDKMKQAFALTCVVLFVEAIGGMLSHSLALLSDAGHVLTDLAAIGLSWYAMVQAQKPPNDTMTYGYHRTGILAALSNGVGLIVIAIVITWQAYGRFQHSEPIDSTWMFISAGVGLLINLYLGLGLRSENNINVRSAVLHMLGDAAASAAVIVAAIVIAATRFYMIDPILSVLIALLIAFGAWRIVQQSVGILMEGTPKGIDLQEVAETIRSTPGVHDVHDLHIWSITSGRNALSCHVVIDGEQTIRHSQAVLREMEHRLVHLGIGHVTVQVEDAEHPHGGSILCCDDPAPEHRDTAK